MVGLIMFSKTGKHYKEFDEIFIDKQNRKYDERVNQQRNLDDFDKMPKRHSVTKHLNIRVAKVNSNRRCVKLVDKSTKKTEADDQKPNSIENTKDSWITVTDKAVYINISVEDVNDIPVSEWENKETGDKKERITLVGSRALLEKVINGEKKGVPLAYFKDD